MFKKRKSEFTIKDIFDFVDKVVKEYGHVLEKRPLGMFYKISLLPYPVDIIKACIKIDIVHNIGNKDYLEIMSLGYTFLSDFIDDETLPKGPDLFSIISKQSDKKDFDADKFLKEMNENKSGVAQGNNLLAVMNKSKNELLQDIIGYINSTESFKTSEPSNEAIKLVSKQIVLVSEYLKKTNKL